MDKTKAEVLSNLAASLPESVKNNALALIERMTTVIEGVGDKPIEWRPSFLRLVQGTTDRNSIPKGTCIGEYVLGETRIGLDDMPFKFIPLRLWTGRQMWAPDKDDASLLCSSPDAKNGYGPRVGNFGTSCYTCPNSKWVDGEGSSCGKTLNMLAITHDLGDIFQYSFAKTSYSVGKDLEKTLSAARVPTYNRIYGLRSQTNASYKAVENPVIVVPADGVEAFPRFTPKEYLGFLKELFDQVSEGRVEHLKAFAEMVERARNEAPKLGGPEVDTRTLTSNTDDNTVTLSVEEGEDAPAANVSALASKYVM